MFLDLEILVEENLSTLLSYAGGMFYAATSAGLAIGLCQKNRSVSGFNIFGCISASHRSWRTPIQ